MLNILLIITLVNSSTTSQRFNVVGFFIYNTVYTNDYVTFVNPIRRFNDMHLSYPRTSSGGVYLTLYDTGGNVIESYVHYYIGNVGDQIRTNTRILFIESISDSDKNVFINNGFRFYDFSF